MTQYSPIFHCAAIASIPLTGDVNTIGLVSGVLVLSSILLLILIIIAIKDESKKNTKPRK